MIFKKDDIYFDGRYFRYKPGIYQELKKVFSDKDIDSEIRKAERWALYNRPKKNWTKFLCNWLNRAEQKRNAPVDEMPQQFGTRTANNPKPLQESLSNLKSQFES